MPTTKRPTVRRILVSLDDTLIDRLDNHTTNRSAYIAHAIRRALEAENA